jgi:type IV secretory pathway VirB4 component
VCQFDLSDMQHHRAVLSADTEKLAALDRARAECGDDPKRWLPRLRELVLGVQQPRAAHLRRVA